MDLSVKNKAKVVRDTLTYFDDFPVFSIVELNITAACTRSCVFCPASDKDFYKKNHIKGKLKPSLYKKLLNDLKSIGYHGRIIFSGFSEPLLHKNLQELVGETKAVLPASSLEIITNGDLLDFPMLDKLFQAGLKFICVSLYDGEHQFEHFNKMKTKAGLSDSQMMLRRRYYQDGDYGLIISNRGGLVDSNQYRDKNESSIETLPLQRICYYPFYMIKMDLNGDMLICSHDWQKRFVVGNILKESVWDIWKKKNLNSLKLSLAHADRNIVPCNTCDVKGDVMGKDSFIAWCKATGINPDSLSRTCSAEGK
ncbi:MAG: S-adenosyl-L-methionine-dependent 2-deoxy-scyllo-inosamine dehydrogenase [Smithella sp. PtaU1.Bin162]|nr:MAG: S-adenosyl-L-methionine-dependent 2-deoxy-scyllo-inosamine dehydrogenase [Smithella sp. PtaU1.Bin162]